MGIRTGSQYLDGIRDGREVWCDGERIKDVTKDPRFAGGASTMAELCDLQNRPDMIETMTYQSPTTGDRVGLSFIQPKSTDDLIRRRKMFKTWSDYTCGMFGRSPDFMNVMLSSYGAACDAFDSEQSKFGKNVAAYYEYARENDIVTTHALVSPQVDRSRAPDAQIKDIAARIVSDNDKGFVINGVRMLATLAAIADDIVVMPAPSYPLTNAEEAKTHAFGFVIPVSTPGLKLIARPSVVHQNAGSPMDYPLSNHFDDSDCMILFDNVLVPWERTFIYRDVEVYNSAQKNTHTHTHTSHQFATKDLAKAEFMRDLAVTVARSTNVDQFLHIQNQLAELIHVAEWVESCIRTSEIDCFQGPGFMFPPQFRRACEIIQTIGAGGLFMVPSFKMLDSDLSPDIEKYFQAANIDSHERIRLFRLACDAALTSFSGRQQLYERYFAGDPVRSSAGYANSFNKEPSIARITALLDRWEAELS